MKDRKSIPSQDEIRSFAAFLKDLETKAPPSKSWLLAQRQKPDDLWSLPAVEREAAFRKFEASCRGPALAKLVENGLPVDWRHDLRFCQDTTEVLLQDLFAHGTWPAPAYAERIGILLRRAKRKDLSDRFDAVWARFST